MSDHEDRRPNPVSADGPTPDRIVELRAALENRPLENRTLENRATERPVTRRAPGATPSAPLGADPLQQARDICLNQLAVRPRSKAELRAALARRKIEPEIAERVLDRLNEVGLVDDAAFAELWVHSRHTYQGQARRALAVELRRKGIDDSVVASAVAAVDHEAEEARARQLVRKKLRSTTTSDDLTKIRRLVGMLARKGYPEGLAYRVVRDELRNTGSDSEHLDTLTD
jgi:regulatory protein